MRVPTSANRRILGTLRASHREGGRPKQHPEEPTAERACPNERFRQGLHSKKIELVIAPGERRARKRSKQGIPQENIRVDTDNLEAAKGAGDAKMVAGPRARIQISRAPAITGGGPRGQRGEDRCWVLGPTLVNASEELDAEVSGSGSVERIGIPQ